MFERDARLTTQLSHIASVGWTVTAVLPEPGHTSYAYTAGLTTDGAPELVITGLRHTIAHALLNDLAARAHDHGIRWRHHDRIPDLLNNLDAVIINGDANDSIFPGTATAIYGRVRLQQIVWPDPKGNFPWQDRYRYPANIQPLLTPPTLTSTHEVTTDDRRTHCADLSGRRNSRKRPV